MRSVLLLLVLLFAACLLAGSTIEALTMTRLKIPELVAENQTVRMECDFRLDLDERLYSVKWYKDGQEFYRYVPNEEPGVTVFRLDGVLVDKDLSFEGSVQLHRVNRASSGRYRCEVSGEAPYFYTVSNHADMTVVVMPVNGPMITNVKPKYHAEDTVRANCTSAPSKPAATLMWYVNDKPADRRWLKGPRVTHAGRNSDLMMSQLGLVFNVTTHHFRRGDLKLKCVASISTMYQRSSRVLRIYGDERFLKQPMESRETRAQGHTRNEPVNGGESCTTTTAVAAGPLTVLSVLSILVVASFAR